MGKATSPTLKLVITTRKFPAVTPETVSLPWPCNGSRPPCGGSFGLSLAATLTKVGAANAEVALANIEARTMNCMSFRISAFSPHDDCG